MCRCTDGHNAIASGGVHKLYSSAPDYPLKSCVPTPLQNGLIGVNAIRSADGLRSVIGGQDFESQLVD